jgi:hypothetical protein
MEEVKNYMLDLVHDSKNSDIPENKDFWDDVLLEVENATTEEELLRIGQEYFSIGSLDEIK